MNRKYPKRPFLNFLVALFQVFFRRDFNYSEEFGTQKVGGGYHKFRLNGSEGFNKIFGVGILENLLGAKSDGNCFKFVVSHFLIVIGNIIANYR